VRRIRDELRRNEGIEVSAETVRRVVNEAGLGNPAVQAGRQPAGERRFEREIPNALWQIDIFTFQTQAPVSGLLVGILDDHSRYLVGTRAIPAADRRGGPGSGQGAIGRGARPGKILSDNGRSLQPGGGRRVSEGAQATGDRACAQRGAPSDDARKIERFWKTIWEEFLEEAVFASFADASQRLEHWWGIIIINGRTRALEGACPADRFYGLAADVEEATRQGCQENALRLAWARRRSRPCICWASWGTRNVRWYAREEIEIRLGETIHEVIRMGSPYGWARTVDWIERKGIDEMEGTRGEESTGCGSGSPGEMTIKQICQTFG